MVIEVHLLISCHCRIPFTRGVLPLRLIIHPICAHLMLMVRGYRCTNANAVPGKLQTSHMSPKLTATLRRAVSSELDYEGFSDVTGTALFPYVISAKYGIYEFTLIYRFDCVCYFEKNAESFRPDVTPKIYELGRPKKRSKSDKKPSKNRTVAFCHFRFSHLVTYSHTCCWDKSESEKRP